MSCCKKEPPKCVRRKKCKLKTIKDKCRKPPKPCVCKCPKPDPPPKTGCTLTIRQDGQWGIGVVLTVYKQNQEQGVIEVSVDSLSFQIEDGDIVKFQWGQEEDPAPWAIEIDGTVVRTGDYGDLTDGSSFFCDPPRTCPEQSLLILREINSDIGPTMGANDAPDLKGYKQYRLYVTKRPNGTPLQSNDCLRAVFGDASNPLYIKSNDTEGFYRDPANVSGTNSSINSAFFSFLGGLQYSSYLTIGLDRQVETGEENITFTPSNGSEFDDFINDGKDICVDDGSFYRVFTGSNSKVSTGVPSGINEIMIGQFTTKGVPTGRVNIGLSLNGNNFVTYSADIPCPTIGPQPEPEP